MERIKTDSQAAVDFKAGNRDPLVEVKDIEAYISQFPREKIEVCNHEFGHALVGEKEHGVSITHISAKKDLTAHPPYLGITKFKGRATAAMIAAGAVAARTEKGTAGDKSHLNAITGGNGESAWVGCLVSARAKLDLSNGKLWDLASCFFLAAGGEGPPEKMHWAFDKAKEVLKLANIPTQIEEADNLLSSNVGYENLESPEKNQEIKDFETEIRDLTDGRVQVIEHNLVTGEVKVEIKFPCCGGKNEHDPDCKVGKKESESKGSNQNKTNK